MLIRPELDPAQRVKTLAHELGHVMLHEPQDATDAATVAACRGQREVEAESVAFLVTSAHGIDSAQYSFPYVAGWAPRTTTTSRRRCAHRRPRPDHRAPNPRPARSRHPGTPDPGAEDQIPSIVPPLCAAVSIHRSSPRRTGLPIRGSADERSPPGEPRRTAPLQHADRIHLSARRISDRQESEHHVAAARVPRARTYREADVATVDTIARELLNLG